MSVGYMFRRFKDALPTGNSLSAESWDRRHRAIQWLLWAHVVGIYIFGVVAGYGLVHPGVETSIVALFAVAASRKGFTRQERACLATFGLVASSAILVHLSGGLIEMHFHFFVMVAVVALYQSWQPFLLAIGFVLIHHGVMGVIDSKSVYNHADAQANPWKWAAIHALFIAGESVAALTTWKLNELSLEAEQATRMALEEAVEDLADAQALAHVGSWEWNVTTDVVSWSDELYQICGVDPATFSPSYAGFMLLVAEDERDAFGKVVGGTLATAADFDENVRIVRPDGSIRLTHAVGRAECDPAGTVTKLFGTLQDVTEKKRLEEKVRHQAFHDSLTGLPNRALFLDRVEHARARQIRGSESLAVLFVDLDDFKSVNDTRGHKAGDNLLVEVGRRLTRVLRPADTIARLGGDEFAILLEEISSIDAATGVADRIMAALTGAEAFSAAAQPVTASIGIVIESPSGVRNADELVRDSDIAMYVAKKRAKGRYEIFDAVMREELSARLGLKVDLQRAIDNKELFLQYQPIVRVDGQGIEGVEALVRWRHPTRGIVPPAEFIPFAEESGLIGQLGHWVLHQACSDAARWQARSSSEHPLRMSVNISASRFCHPNFIEELKEVLAEFPLAPNSLVLEITESVLIKGSEVVSQRFAEVKELGILLAIDDFGTGYSSLGYLRDFPIDLLKIDKSFIDFVACGPEESALARAVVKLGDALGLSVVAEGVEHENQSEVLAAMGCEFAQGFLFSRPVDREEIDALLKNADASLVAAPA
ncbi:MAG: hypothetical protein QOF16_349 [Actinomycetota bacterium]|nr:hypothetical protein [Actinomycetota bacterium]